jgi:hypothetical protein
MKSSDRDKLLGEILRDENLEHARAASLDGMLRAVRGRRHYRAALSGAAAALVLGAVMLVVTRRAPSPSESSALAGVKSSGVRIVTDEQLLALFPDRSVALIGRPGEQRLVFLEGSNPSSPAAQTR